MLRRISQLYRLLSLRARAGVLGTIVLLIAERLVLAAGALGLAGRLTVTWAASAGVVALWGIRSVVRQSVTSEARERVTMLIAETALEQGADGSFLAGEEADAAVYEGRSCAEQVIVRHLPSLVADPIAAALLLGIIRPAGVPVFAGLVAISVAATLLIALRNLTVSRQRGAWQKYVGIARDTLTSIRAATELIASGHEHAYLERLRTSVKDWTTTATRAERSIALFQRIPFAALVAVAAVVFVQTQSLELGRLIRLGIFLPPLAGLMRTLFELVRTAPRIHTLGSALDARSGKKDDAARLPPPPTPCEIRFESVSFAYGDIAVLKDVSFVWKPGEVLGIQGPNGSGKSTLLRLMLGLLQPTAGRITVGGIDLRELDLPAWRRRIAYLPQRPYLPEKCTVIEAMRLTAPELTEDEARKALSATAVWERLERAGTREPQTTTLLQTRIATLSVGMRQRVMLARVLFAQRGILLLDEPDENLDHLGRDWLINLATHQKGNCGIAIATHGGDLLSRASYRVIL